MAEYISREAIIEELEEEIQAEWHLEDVWINKGLKTALKDIKRLPAADVQPALNEKEYESLCKRMAECTNMGVEDGHIAADDILLEALEKMGYEKLVELYQAFDKWYA